MSERVLITGAQGFVGRYLAAYLLRSNSGVNIQGIGRSPRSSDAFTHLSPGEQHLFPLRCQRI